MSKPDPGFFRRMLEVTPGGPDEILYVGDRLDNDIRPAASLGLRTALIRQGPWGSSSRTIRRGDWADPEAGKVRFGDYASNWVSDHVFKPRTEGLYRSQLKNHLAPTFGKKDLRDIHEADIRRWRRNASTRGRVRPGRSGR